MVSMPCLGGVESKATHVGYGDYCLLMYGNQFCPLLITDCDNDAVKGSEKFPYFTANTYWKLCLASMLHGPVATLAKVP